MVKDKYYRVNALQCWNCHWEGDLRIPFGTLISEALCIRCGCVALTYKVTLKVEKEDKENDNQN